MAKKTVDEKAYSTSLDVFEKQLVLGIKYDNICIMDSQNTVDMRTKEIAILRDLIKNEKRQMSLSKKSKALSQTRLAEYRESEELG